MGLNDFLSNVIKYNHLCSKSPSFTFYFCSNRPKKLLLQFNPIWLTWGIRIGYCLASLIAKFNYPIAPHNPVGGKVLRMGKSKAYYGFGEKGNAVIWTDHPRGREVALWCGVAKYCSKGLAVLTPLMRIIDDATVQAHSEKGLSYQLQFHFNESIQNTLLFERGKCLLSKQCKWGLFIWN